MLILTSFSIGKFFHTVDGRRVTVLSKHPRKEFFEIEENDHSPRYWVTHNGDYDVTGAGKPDSRDLVKETTGMLRITIDDGKRTLDLIPDEERTDGYLLRKLFGYGNCWVDKSTMRITELHGNKNIGTARLP